MAHSQYSKESHPSTISEPVRARDLLSISSIGRKVSGVPFFLEPTIQLGMSQQGLTMLVVWDGFGHELIPLFSLYPFKYFHH
jgi:hypothetical protein